MDEIEAGASTILNLVPEPYGDDAEAERNKKEYELLGIHDLDYDRQPLIFLQAFVEHRRAELKLLQVQQPAESDSETEETPSKRRKIALRVASPADHLDQALELY